MTLDYKIKVMKEKNGRAGFSNIPTVVIDTALVGVSGTRVGRALGKAKWGRTRHTLLYYSCMYLSTRIYFVLF